MLYFIYLFIYFNIFIIINMTKIIIYIFVQKMNDTSPITLVKLITPKLSHISI